MLLNARIDMITIHLRQITDVHPKSKCPKIIWTIPNGFQTSSCQISRCPIRFLSIKPATATDNRLCRGSLSIFCSHISFSRLYFNVTHCMSSCVIVSDCLILSETNRVRLFADFSSLRTYHSLNTVHIIKHIHIGIIMNDEFGVPGLTNSSH
jgi:hypothetical protein